MTSQLIGISIVADCAATLDSIAIPAQYLNIYQNIVNTNMPGQSNH